MIRCNTCNEAIRDLPASWVGAEGDVFCCLDCLSDAEPLPSILFADDPSELIDLARLARGE